MHASVRFYGEALRIEIAWIRSNSAALVKVGFIFPVLVGFNFPVSDHHSKPTAPTRSRSFMR